MSITNWWGAICFIGFFGGFIVASAIYHIWLLFKLLKGGVKGEGKHKTSRNKKRAA